MYVGLNIKRERMRKSMSQEELGKKVGFTKGTISKIESGTMDPSTETLADIANALECSVVELFHEGASAKEETLSFWNRIKSVCTRTGITQKDLYEAAGLDPKVVFHWSNVCVLPSVDAILKFSAYLGVDVYWLVYGNEIPNVQTMKEKLDAKRPQTLDGALAEIEALKKEIEELKGKAQR